MIKRLNLGSLAAFCLIAVVSGLGGLACGGAANNANQAVNTNTGTPAPVTPTPDPCAAKSDNEIAQAIYAALKIDFSAQLGHINVFVKTDPVTKKREIKLQGWTDKEADWNTVTDIVKNTACVKDPDFSMFYKTKPTSGPIVKPSTGVCAEGYEPCRDMCVPTGQCTPIENDKRKTKP